MRIGSTTALIAIAGLANCTAPAPPEPSADEVRATLLAEANAFSAAYMNGDYGAIEAAYTEDAVAIPGGGEPVTGPAAIRELFVLPEGASVVHHRLMPREVVVSGDHAYDWGTYEVQSARNGETGDMRRGTYTVVWRRGEDGRWRMKIDMWSIINRS